MWRLEPLNLESKNRGEGSTPCLSRQADSESYSLFCCKNRDVARIEPEVSFQSLEQREAVMPAAFFVIIPTRYS
jgi:hypothetical protein